MFERAYLKNLAKERIRVARGTVIAVAVIAALLCGELSVGSPLSGFNSRVSVDSDEFFSGGGSIWGELSGFLPVLLGAVLAAIFLVSVVALVYSVFVGNVIQVGARGWFMRFWRGEIPSVGELFASFRIYKPSLLTALLRNVYTFLWSLLFVIPGIVKAYAYSMADYIIYENPNISANEALRLSQELTRGAKGDLFVLDLSFLGWHFLSALTLGILGILYVNPYVYTTHAAVYDSLKATAIQSGRLTWADFGQMAPGYGTNGNISGEGVC